ncbi:hypothetical protein [Microbulbifer sp. S227A]|uniref:hypothetical protein n=1 Tax=Microbulbifer sp. S227A TaxID=3415131 RepID=UPI003C7C940C
MRKVRRRAWVNKPASERVRVLGHRAYVGGGTPEMWYGIGKQQYHWLVSQGLRPDHRFLDIACGSLRLGQYLIPFLNQGQYFGLEPEAELVEKGLAEELLYDIAEIKKPTFAHNYDFDFSFVDGYDYAIAQSLVTHLNLEDTTRLLAGLHKVSGPQSTFFFTFFEGDSARNPKGPSHANKRWRYSFETMAEIGAETGWTLDYIGDWKHKRRQMMIRARPA